MGLDTGCRQGELLALKWRDVDLPRRELTVRKAKSGKTRIVP
jgi:integrase